MYELNPPAVFAHESVMDDPRYRARLERVVSALSEPIEPEVYRDEDYKNDWKGTYQDKLLPVGTYFYLITINDDKKTKYHGHVYIQRE